MIDIDLFFSYVKKGVFTVEKHPESDLYIFGYQTGPYSGGNKFWNDITKQMRGLIVNSKGEVIARSFEKFFTFRKYLSEDFVMLSEGQTTTLPDLPYKIYEKMDGSLAILYWIGDTPYLSTQRSFTSIKAQKSTKILHKKYSHLFSKLKRDRTYIFESISQDTEVLIDYTDLEELILIGVLDNESGKDLPLENIGFKIAKDWTKDLEYIKDLKELENLNLKNLEGFVVVYENGLRIKIKFPWYQTAHSILNKMILLEHHQDLLGKRLKNILNLPENLPSKEKIWKRFSQGEKPKEILFDFPNGYNFMGILHWLDNEYIEFTESLNSSQKINLDNQEKLDLNELVYLPKSENIMYQRMLNLKNKYD